MVFTSAEFILFLPVVLAGFFLLPLRLKWAWLLAASLFFYGYTTPWYLALLFTATVSGYLAALAISVAPSVALRRAALAAGIAINLAMLFYFKYFDLFASSANALAARAGAGAPFELRHIILPIGISFFVFQVIGYMIDVYRRVVDVERHFGIFFLFKAFFPQLVAGPIERS